jgi:hypothetical protein
MSRSRPVVRIIKYRARQDAKAYRAVHIDIRLRQSRCEGLDGRGVSIDRST